MNNSISDGYAKTEACSRANLLCKTGLLLALSLSFTSLFAQTWYTDNDHDGFGATGSGHTSYVSGDVLDDQDCNDAVPNNPIWGNVGTGDISSPNTGLITKIAIAPDGTPIALYRTAALNVVVKQFNSATSTWVTLGGDPITTAISGAVTIDYPDLAVDSHGIPYISFMDNDGSDTRVTVIKYDVSLNTWVLAGGRRFSGALRATASASITMDGDVPYVITTLSAGSNVIVMTLNSGNWVTVGGSLLPMSGDVKESALSVDGNGILYAAVVRTDNQAVVLTCDPSAAIPAWTQVGTTTFPFFTFTRNEVPQLALNSANEPHIAYYDETADAVIVQKYTGGTWSSVGSSAVQTGLGGSASANPLVTLAVDNLDVPIVALLNGTPKVVVLRKLNATNAWVDASVSAMEGRSLSLAISPRNNAPYLSFDNLTSGDYAYVQSVVPEIVYPSITGVTASSSFLCSGESASLSVGPGSYTGHAVEWHWYSGSCGGSAVGTGNSINTGSLTATTTYYVRPEEGCTGSVSCTAMVIAVSPKPTWYLDNDNDGFGSSSATQDDCGPTPPVGYVINNADCNDNSVNNTAEWAAVGNPASTGASTFNAIAFDGSTPFVAFRDAAVAKAVVMTYTSGAWTAVGGTGGISAGSVSNINIAFYAGAPFVAYRDLANGNKPTVMTYNGSSWSSVGVAAFTPATADNISMAIDRNDGTIYVLFSDGTAGLSNKASVMKYTGTVWTYVGTAGFSAGTASQTSITVDARGTPYVSYHDATNAKIAVKKFDGTTWVAVGAAMGFSAGSVAYTSIRVDNRGTPYVAYRDNGASVGGKAAVMKFDGSAWVAVGSATGISTGTATYVTLALDKAGTPYVAYTETGTTPTSRVTVQKFNGIAWVGVGAGGSGSVGTSQHAFLAIDGDNVPYVACADGSTSPVLRSSVRKMSPVANAPGAPVISASATSLCPGISATAELSLTSGVKNDATHWQWYQSACGTAAGGTALSSVANIGDPITVSESATPGDVVRYFVRGEGTCVATPATCAFVDITTNVNLSVSQFPPVTITQCAGTTLSLNSTATGTGVAYEWRKDGALLGTTVDDHNLGTLSASDDATYTLKITGACNSTGFTYNTDLTVNEILAVSQFPPATITQCAGTTLSLNSEATGTGVAYEWRKDGALLGTTIDDHNLGTLSASDDATYTLKITGACNTTGFTYNTDVTVNENLAVSQFPPATITQCAGTALSLNSEATGTGVAYEWRKDGTLLGTTVDDHNLGTLSASDDATYTLKITGACNSTGFTYNTDLTVNEILAVSQFPPATITQCAGTTLSLNSTATGTGVAYEWRKDGALLGTTIDDHNLGTLSASDDATYTLKITGACNSTGFTYNTDLTVNEILAVSQFPPATITQCAGTTLSLNSEATGTGVAYEWRKDGTLLGTTVDDHNLGTLSASDDATYTLKITGACNSTGFTYNTDLTVNEILAVSQFPPATITQCAGTTLSLNSEATGTGVAYEWRKDGALLGTTIDDHNLGTLSASDDATYTLKITGTCNSTGFTYNTDLTVNEILAVSQFPPATITQCAGTTLSLNSEATGTGVAYEWRKDGALLGTTVDDHNLGTLSASDDATYTLKITGACNSTGFTYNTDLTVNEILAVSQFPPATITQCAGTTLSLNSTATGTGVAYEWRKDGALLGTTIDDHNLGTLSASDDATYTLKITGACNTTGFTYNTDLTVNEILAVSQFPPATITQCAGTALSLNSEATGTGVAYEWRKDGALLGTTVDDHNLGTISASDDATYTLKITGTCNSTGFTYNTDLTVNEILAVSQFPPATITQCAGTTVSLNSAATGTDVTYEWQKDGVTVSPASLTGNNYSRSNITSSDEGTYTVVMRSACDAAGIARSATLTVQEGTVITAQPAEANACDGASEVRFSVSATGTNLNYQWRTNNGASGTWRDITGENDRELVVRSINSSMHNRSYHVVVTSTCSPNMTSGDARLLISAVGTVTLHRENPATANDPAATVVCEGSEATFTGVVSGTATGYMYQWQQNNGSGWADIAGETGRSMTLPSIPQSVSNTSYRVVAGNPGCTPVASAATLMTVNALSNITAHPTDAVTCEGGSARFSVSVTGTALAYQWQMHNGNAWENLPGAINPELNLLHISSIMNAYQYRVIVDAAGCTPVTSDVADLTVSRLPEMIAPPAPAEVCMDQNAVFTVVAEGTDISYTWEENRGSEWTELAGENSASLLLRRVPPGMNGYLYRVRVISPGCTPITSGGAQLIINTQPGQAGCTQSLLISEGVSPNGDDQLDRWIIEGIELYPNNNVKLYNVWGDLVFERKGYDNELHAWRGETNKGLKIGSEAPDGTYFYFIDLGNDDDSVLRGFVVLKR